MDIQLKYRIPNSKFRLSNHRLNIELRRYNSVPTEYRICIFCQQSNNAIFNIIIIDSEYHAFFKCVKYNIVRQSYLFNWDVYTWNRTSRLLCFFVLPNP